MGLVPVTEDAAALYETWVGWGGEGIVLKEPTSIYRPGMRSPAWLKVKSKVTIEIVVTGGSSEPILWGDWGLAVMLDIGYTHPRDGKTIQIRQAIRIRRDEPFTLRTGKRAELVCWGLMPSRDVAAPAVRAVVGPLALPACLFYRPISSSAFRAIRR